MATQAAQRATTARRMIDPLTCEGHAIATCVGQNMVGLTPPGNAQWGPEHCGAMHPWESAGGSSLLGPLLAWPQAAGGLTVGQSDRSRLAFGPSAASRSALPPERGAATVW